MNTYRVPNVVVYMILASGAFLLAATLTLCILVFNATQETVENRKVGCISRALDGQKYAPQCEEFVNGK
jgi:hypothetical protein